MPRKKKNAKQENRFNAWSVYGKKERRELERFCREYMRFLDGGKTVRRAISRLLGLLDGSDSRDLMEYRGKLRKGSLYHLCNKRKSLAVIKYGKKPLQEGLRVLVAHVDSPRLDLKPNPLCDNGELAVLKTHYYGYIKKYQWTAFPLAVHVTFCTGDGDLKEFVMGEDPREPALFLTDLPPHLAKMQAKRTASQVIEGEEMGIVAGSIPPEGDAESVAEAVASLLEQRWGLTKEDFKWAEIELVPAVQAREAGFDGSFIAAYGHDDKACTWAMFKAVLDAETPQYTSVCFIVNKEETGSQDQTSARSRFILQTLELLAETGGVSSRKDFARMLSNSCVMSGDTMAPYDPNFPGVFDPSNSYYCGKGVVVEKNCGTGGKIGATETRAEYLAFLRTVLDEAGVVYQFGEMGKLEEGGGSTVGQFLGNLNMDVVDCGPPVLSLHAPMELMNKADLWETYRAAGAFLRYDGSPSPTV